MKTLKIIYITLLIFILSIVLGCVCLYYYNESINKTVGLTTYDFYHEEIPASFDGYKIFMVSDLHNAPFSGEINEHIRNTKPDIIAFTGDMVQLPSDDLTEFLKIVKEFRDDIPCYFVSGNHEKQNKSYWDITCKLWDEGVIVLEDDSVEIKKNKDSFLLVGAQDPEFDTLEENHYDKIREEINEEFPDGPCFSVLLAHRADLYPEIKDTRADLILSGHLHGGIIRLPFVGGLIGREGTIEYPEYEYGLIKEGSSASMIVSSGCDQNPKKKRVFNPPEVVLITLKCKEK